MTEESTRRFLARLWALQAEAEMTNAELSRRLGCNPSYINHLKKGRPGRGKRVGLKFALAATHEFPELASLLLADFPVGNDTVLPGNEGEVPQ